jgi:hypothetical protein
MIRVTQRNAKPLSGSARPSVLLGLGGLLKGLEGLHGALGVGVHVDVAEHAEGGLGLGLVHKIAGVMHYDRIENKNILTLSIPYRHSAAFTK